MKKGSHIRISTIFFSLLLLFGCAVFPSNFQGGFELTAYASSDILSEIPEYDGSPYTIVNDNIPEFDADDFTVESFEIYSDLDSLGRCGVAYANIGVDIMPTESRGDISSIHPTGWVQGKYEIVSGGYLYNRCHLIAFELTGENANEKNLITGTRYFNVEGMLPFENMVADYVKETENHVLYRVTPVYEEENLVANGVQMEAESVEDDGEGVLFNVYCYNVQPGVTIDYSTGENWLTDDADTETEYIEVADLIIQEDETKLSETDIESENISESEESEKAEEITEEPPETIPEETEEQVTEVIEDETEQWVYDGSLDLTEMTIDELKTFEDEIDDVIKLYHKPENKTKNDALDMVKGEIEEVFEQNDISVSWPWMGYDYTKDWDFYTVSTSLKYKEEDSKKSTNADVYAELLISGDESTICYITVADTVLIDEKDQIPDCLWLNAPEPYINEQTGLDLSVMEEDELENLKDRIKEEIAENHTTDPVVEDLVLSMTKYQVENQYNDPDWPWLNYTYTCDWGFYTLETSVTYKDSDDKKQKEQVYAEAYPSDDDYKLFYLSVGDDVLIDKREELPVEFRTGEVAESETAVTESEAVQTEETETDINEKETETEPSTGKAVTTTKTDTTTNTNVIKETETETESETEEDILYEKGSRGDSVKELQEKLISLGYLSGTADGIFGDMTEDAVKKFQKANGLVETGYVTAKMLDKIEEVENKAGKKKKEETETSSTEPAEISEKDKETMVWIPNSGSKYHSTPYCSGMKNPTQVTEAEAIARGYEPCLRCH